MAQGGIGNQSPPTLFQARLETSGGVSSTLTLSQYIGNKVVVSGLTVSIPAVGMTRNIVDDLINAVGGDTGAPPAANTLYYVYISNRKANFSPESIRLSAQAPTLVSGVKYLGSSGNALNWRFVGWVRTNATPQFASNDSQSFIVNYYNRLRKTMFSVLGADKTLNSVVWGQVDPTGSLTCEFISNGEDSVDLAAVSTISSGTIQIWGTGVALDSVTTPVACGFGGRGGTSLFSDINVPFGSIPSEGYHYATMLAAENDSVTYSKTDPIFGTNAACTYIEVSLFV